MLHQTDFTFSEDLMPREEGATRYIVLHHSEVATPHTAADIHHWHQNKGWAGIGYHYFIDKEGEVYECRPRQMVGAHVYGHNHESIGVCFEGDFNKEQLSEKQETAAVKLLSLLSLAYPVAQLCRHSDFNNAKHCPGENFPFERTKQRIKECVWNMLGINTNSNISSSHPQAFYT